MANVSFTGLPVSGSITDSSVFAVVVGGTTSQVSGANIKTYMNNGSSSTANLKFTANAMYNLGGVIVENADLTHGATSALILPENGNTSAPLYVTNSYGNVVLQSGDTGDTNSWTLGSDGALNLPNHVDGEGAVVQSTQPIRVISGSSQWKFDNGGEITFPDGTVGGAVEGANTFGFYNSNANTQYLFEADSNVWNLDGATGNLNLPRQGSIGETSIPGGGLAGNTIALKPSGGTNTNQQLLVYPTIGTDNNHLHLTSGNLYDTELFLGSDDLYVKLANTGNIVLNANNSTGNTAQLVLGSDSNVVLPTISLGGGLDEQTVVRSQRKIIPPYRWSTQITGGTPALVYTVSSNSITSMKVTIQVQHNGLGMELFDVYATYVGADTFYTVSNRVAPPTITDSLVSVSLTDSNQMRIVVGITSGATTSWVTYDATEFGIPND